MSNYIKAMEVDNDPICEMEEKTKHTQGPWHLGTGNGEGSIFTDAETRMRITDKGTTLYPICKVTDGWNKEEDEANARLIASSPKLLEALKDVTEQLGLYLSAIEDGKDDDAESAYQHGLAIIAKAEGRE